MRRIFLSIVLLAMLTAIGCGEKGNSSPNGGSSQPMTVDEYVAACAGLDDDLDAIYNVEEPRDVDNILDGMEGLRDETATWNPPSELEELHQVRLEAFDFTIRYLKESGLLERQRKALEAEQSGDLERMNEVVAEMMEPMDAGLEAELEASDARLEKAQDSLSPETYDLLYEAGCIL